MDIIYFDNSATTRVSEAALDAAERALRCDWGNPSSVHGKGIEAERLVSAARAGIVRALGVKNPRSGRLIFTGSGTEADNLAISGSIYGKKYRFRPRIVTTDSEHPAVTSTVNFAEAHGFEVIRLSTKGGIIDDEELYSALTPETVLVSVMRVNNETGAVYDVGKIFSLAKQRCPEAVTHCDAVQGFLKLNCAPSKLNADLVTVSGHKIGAPKGIGALWCSEELIFHKRLKPVIFGGGQEDGLRSGTENVCGIAGMGAAAEERAQNMSSDRETVTALRERLISALPDGVSVNQPLGEYLQNIVSLHVPGIKSEVLVRHMSANGVCISAGSACSSKKLKTSPVLSSFGLDPTRADSTVRISFSHENTLPEVDTFISLLKEAMGKLVKR